MSNFRKRIQKSHMILSCLIVIGSAVPAYYYGKPWLQYHHENLVTYDCRLQSESIPVGTKYPGRVESILVEVGRHVQTGDLVATMDTSELNARMDRAIATIKLAEANSTAEKVAIEKTLATILAQQDCLNAKSKVANSRFHAVQLETKWIEKQLARARKLSRRGSIADAELEKIMREKDANESLARIAGEEDSIARLDLAALKLKVEEIKARTEKLAVYDQEIAIAKTELKSVQEQKDAAKIRARIDGVVTHIYRGAGSSLKLGDPIMQIQSDDVWCEAWLDETKLTYIEIGSNVAIRLKALADKEFQGRVSSFLAATTGRSPQPSENPVLQPNSKICIRVDLHESDHFHLMPGLTGTAAISLSNHSKSKSYQLAGKIDLQ